MSMRVVSHTRESVAGPRGLTAPQEELHVSDTNSGPWNTTASLLTGMENRSSDQHTASSDAQKGKTPVVVLQICAEGCRRKRSDTKEAPHDQLHVVRLCHTCLMTHHRVVACSPYHSSDRTGPKAKPSSKAEGDGASQNGPSSR